MIEEMKKDHSYEQPDNPKTIRSLNNKPDTTIELVSYVPDSHIRLWYNVQNDNYEPHQHDALEIIFCVKNKYKVIVADKEYLLNEGEILFIPPYTLHELICVEEGARFIHLINIDYFKSLSDYKKIKQILMNPLLISEESYPDCYFDLTQHFNHLIDLYFAGDIFWESMIFSQITQIFYYIAKENSSEAEQMAPNPAIIHKNRLGRISAALYYIDNNYTEDITLEQVADYIGFSKYHFSRLFKDATGKTFYDYLCQRRIQSAQTLLLSGVSITDLAFQSGFNNITTFNRCFKKYTGFTPSEYRKDYHKK